MKAANEALSTETPTAVTFDTLSAAQALRKSGFEDRQAEAIVTTISKAMSETLATKADLELQGHKTRGEIVATRTDLEKQTAATRGEIVATRTDLEKQTAATRAEIVATRTDLEKQTAATRAEIVATRTDLEKQIAATRAEIVATRTDLEKQIAATRAEIEKLTQTMVSMQDKTLIRLGGLVVSMTFLLLAVGPFYIRWVMSMMAS